MQIQFIKRCNQWLASWFLVWVLIQTPLTVWLSSMWPDGRFIFKTLSEIYLLLLVLLNAVIVIKQPDYFKNIWRLTGVRLITIYILLHMVSLMINRVDVVSAVGGLLLNLRFLTLFMIMMAASGDDRTYLKRVGRRWWWTGLAVMVFGLLQITIFPKDLLSHFGYSEQTIKPYLMIDQNPHLVRINSTLRGPNMLGALCVLMWSVGLYRYLKQPQQRGYLGLLSLIGVVTIYSWSRSAWLAILVSSLLVLTMTVSKKHWRQFMRVGLSAMIILFIVLGYSLTQFPDSRLAYYFNHVVLHYNPESQSVSKSNAEHSSSIQQAIVKVQQRPLGWGVGTTGSPSIYNQQLQIVENYWLMLAVELGVIGLLVFSVIVGWVMWYLWKFSPAPWTVELLAGGVGLLFISLVLPIWTDGAIGYSWWGLTGAALAHCLIIQKQGNK